MTKQDKSTTLEAKSPEAEMAALDKQIQDMEAELTAEAAPLTWEQVTATTAEELAHKEQRKGILPRLIRAAKIKRLELQIQRDRGSIEPLDAARAKAHEKLERATAKRWEAVEEEQAARGEWGKVHERIINLERRIKLEEREVAELRGER